MTATRTDNPDRQLGPKRVRTRCRRQCMRWLTRASPKQRTASRTRRPPPRKQPMSSNSAYTVAAKGATDYNLKVFEIARFNTNAAFDYARELLGVKSPVGVCRTVDRTLAPAIRNHDGAEQRTCDFGSEGLGRDRRAARDWRIGPGPVLRHGGLAWSNVDRRDDRRCLAASCRDTLNLSCCTAGGGMRIWRRPELDHSRPNISSVDFSKRIVDRLQSAGHVASYSPTPPTRT